MKKILTFSALLIVFVAIFSSCSRRDYYDDNYNGERAVVFDYRSGYPYTIIQFDNDGTYAVIDILENQQYWPERYDVLVGTFDKGQRTVRNKTTGEQIRIDVLEFENTKSEAYADLDYYVNTYGFAKKTDIQGTNRRSTVQ